jgi:hypothetical protein
MIVWFLLGWTESTPSELAVSWVDGAVDIDVTSLSSASDCAVTWKLTDGLTSVEWEESVSGGTTSRLAARAPSLSTKAPTLLLSAQVSCWGEKGQLEGRASAGARAVQQLAGELVAVDISTLLTPLADGSVLAAAPVVVMQEDLVPSYDPDQHYQPDRED